VSVIGAAQIPLIRLPDDSIEATNCALRVRSDSCVLKGMRNGRLLELTAAAGALTVMFVEALPKSPAFQELGGQLLSSGTSAEANYRAAKRARSPAEFVAKLKIVEEEADESMVWIDRIRTAKLPSALHQDAERLRDMFDQIVAMTVESIKTTKARHLKPPRPRRHRNSW